MKNLNTKLIFLVSFITRLPIVLGLYNLKTFMRYLPYHNFIRAEQLINGGTISNPDAWSSYYLFLGFYYRFLKHLGLNFYDLKLLVFANILLTSFALVFVYKIIEKITNRDQAFIITLIIALYYPLYYFNAMNLSENYFFFFLIVGLYLFIFSQKWYFYLLSGLFFGAAVVNRPVFTSFFPFLIIWSYIYKTKKSTMIKRLILIFLPIFFIIFITAFTNWRLNNKKYFSFLTTNGGVNFALTQCQLKSIRYDVKNDVFRFNPPVYFKTNKPVVKTSVPFSNQLFYFQMGLHCLRENPKQLVTNFVHVANVFHSILYPDFLDQSWHRNMIVFWKSLVFSLFFLYLFYPFLFKKGRPIYILLSFLLCSLFISVYFFSPGEERYLVPYAFVILMFGLIVFIHFLSKIKKSLFFICLFFVIFIISLVCFFNNQSINNFYYIVLEKNTVLPRVEKIYSWLINSVNKEGLLYYAYDPKTKQSFSLQSNHIRNLYSILTLIKTESTQSSQNKTKAQTLIINTLNYYRRFLITRNNHAYIYIDNTSSLAFNAFLLRIFIARPDLEFSTGTIEKLAYAIVDRQKDDGSYQTDYLNPQSDPARILSGEVMLALVEAYEKTGNQAFLGSVQKAFIYYKNDWKKNHFYYIHWLTQAFAKLYSITPKAVIAQTIYEMNDWMIKNYQETNLSQPQLIGSIATRKERGVATGFMLESLNDAYRVATQRLDIVKMHQYSQSIALGIRFLNFLQNTSNADKKAFGGIKYNFDNPLLTIDNASHALNAYIKTLDNFVVN